jgi:hypothetical protein
VSVDRARRDGGDRLLRDDGHIGGLTAEPVTTRTTEPAARSDQTS